MHTDTRTSTPRYRERLSPSLWLLVAAAVGAPMIALVLTPAGATMALVAGVAFSALVIVLLVVTSPTVSVADGVLRAGRAHIDVDLLGDPTALTGEDARLARGRDLDPRSWTLLRGGIDGVVVIPNTDEKDPAPSWIISSRTPDRLAAVVRRARTTPRTPGR